MSAFHPISTTLPHTMVDNNAIDDTISLSDIFVRCDGDSSDGDGDDMPHFLHRYPLWITTAMTIYSLLTTTATTTMLQKRRR